MTTKPEEQFFKAFGVEPEYIYIEYCSLTDKNGIIQSPKYPEITDRKLLQLLCIYNDMQGCIEECITPCKYEDAKEMILSTLVNEKTNLTDYEEGAYMDVMTKQIQQLFKEGE